ncbi:MAG: hypothetical protein GY787_23465 [Alteromonadales bacterium]|nr:hypothetical protein [Alteromonadales bacterium]
MESRIKHIYLKALCITFVIITFSLIIDFYPPKTIPLVATDVADMSALKAEDLVVQGYDSEGRLWASRGMWAYRLDESFSQFQRQYRVPTGVSLFWLRNFAIVRTLTRRHECIELLPSLAGETLAMSAGKLWLKKGDEDFKEVFTLDHYGIGDPGVRNDGLVRASESSLFLGEYFRNTKRGPVKLLRSLDNGLNWETAYEFPPGSIRHIHAVQQDAYSNRLWVLTGDHDHEASIYWSDDGGKQLHSLGTDAQRWRATQVVFTEKSIIWGADVTRVRGNESGIYRWDRELNTLNKLRDVDGAIFYATKLAGDTIVMTTVREGGGNEKDLLTRLYVFSEESESHDIKEIEFGIWKWQGKYAKLRLQRGQGATHLAITVLNQTTHDNALLIIPEAELKKVTGLQ